MTHVRIYEWLRLPESRGQRVDLLIGDPTIFEHHSNLVDHRLASRAAFNFTFVDVPELLFRPLSEPLQCVERHDNLVDLFHEFVPIRLV